MERLTSANKNRRGGTVLRRLHDGVKGKPPKARLERRVWRMSSRWPRGSKVQRRVGRGCNWRWICWAKRCRRCRSSGIHICWLRSCKASTALAPAWAFSTAGAVLSLLVSLLGLGWLAPLLGVLLLASEALSWICCTMLRRSRRARV